MTSSQGLLLLPLIFAVHCYEEYYSFEDFADIYFTGIKQRFRDRAGFATTLMLLNIIIAGVVIINFFWSTTTAKYAAYLLFLAVFINALQHMVVSIKHKRMTAGTYTAVGLITPYSLALLYCTDIAKYLAAHPFSIVWALLLTVVLPIVSLTLVLVVTGKLQSKE